MEKEVASLSHFTLHLDKALSSSIQKAAWNPEKDLLAMVTNDQQLVLHRFNWQRLWAISPEKKATCICWRPDGKALAVGHEDGSISLHDVENGDLLQQISTHQSSVQCLDWVQEEQLAMGDADSLFLYKDRTPRFFPPPPKQPPMPGTSSAFDMSAVLSSADGQQGAESQSDLTVSYQQINVLCSGDRDGTVCLSIFGLFPIGKLSIHDLKIYFAVGEKNRGIGPAYQIFDGHVLKVSLSRDLRQMVVLFHGHLIVDKSERISGSENTIAGLFCIHLNTTLLGDRRKELHQVALQASSIEELVHTLQASISVMHKQWSDAINMFTGKFWNLSGMLREHGSQASPCDEFLSLLSCGSASPGLHQFLAGSLGEGPAAEILAFRVAELRGLSRWRGRFHCIGLDERLMDQVMEESGMVLVQVERFLRIVSDAVGQFRLFFLWLTKSLRRLDGEPSSQTEQLPVIDSVGVANFLKTQFDQDPIGPHLGSISEGVSLNVDLEELRRLQELALMGGFSDCTFLQRTLAQQIHQLHISCQEAFCMPWKVVSPKMYCDSMLRLCPLQTPLPRDLKIPISMASYEVKLSTLDNEPLTRGKTSVSVEYICFHMLDATLATDPSIIGIIRQHNENSKGDELVVGRGRREIIALRIQDGLHCTDLALYKDRQLVLLLGRKKIPENDLSGQAYLMVLETENLPFVTIMPSLISELDLLHLCFSMGGVVGITLNDGKARVVSHLDAVPPLAVSASRGLACVFAGHQRALLYDLEDDDNAKDQEMD
eukprot:c25944_g1_i2 orf=60-2372(+)